MHIKRKLESEAQPGLESCLHSAARERARPEKWLNSFLFSVFYNILTLYQVNHPGSPSPFPAIRHSPTQDSTPLPCITPSLVPNRWAQSQWATQQPPIPKQTTPCFSYCFLQEPRQRLWTMHSHPLTEPRASPVGSWHGGTSASGTASHCCFVDDGHLPVLLPASEQKQNPGLRKGWKRDGRAEEGGDRDKREKGHREKRLRGERRLKKREVEM